MKLPKIRHGDRAFLYMERYVDEGTKTYSPFAARSEVAPPYRPRSSQPSFKLVSVMAPRSAVSCFEADPPTALRDFYIRPQETRFHIHPEIWTGSGIDHLEELRALRQGEPVRVAPTASTRTVLTTETPEGVPPHFIKLHCPRRISRFNRRFRQKNISNSILASQDVVQVRFEKFAHLPDVLGFTYGDSSDAWGFLVRERNARPFRPHRFLVPYFSLYGGDLKHCDDTPLLVQLIERLGADAQSFVVEEIMIPVLECWARVVRERGILLESHAQNILLELDKDLRPTRVVHRDFDVWVDAETRKRKGLDELPSSIDTDAPQSREQHYSLVYDHFIGGELFDYLLGVLTRYYGADERAVRGRIVEAFHLNFPDAANFFPAGTTYYFSNEDLPDNRVRLVDTQRPPRWR